MLNTFAPPFKVVAIYFIMGFCYLFSLLFLFPYLDNDFYSHLFKAFLHCFFAGFALNVIIGSLYQLSSVIYEKAFISIKCVFIIALITNISLACMIYAFYSFDYELLKFFVSVVVICIFYFIVLFMMSFFDFSNISKIALFLGVLFLALGLICAVVLSLILNAVLDYDYELFLKLHIYFMLGFILFICIGAASILLPMFALTHKHKNYLLWLSLFSYFFAFFNQFIAVLSLCSFALWCLYILKIRARKAKDYWNLNILFACLGVILVSFEFIIKDYTMALNLLIFACILPFIIAHIYKILPFLIWYHFISKLVGKCKVPLLSDMVISKLAYISIIIHIALVISLYIKPLVYLYFALLLGVFINVIKFFTYINYKGELNEKGNN